MVARPAVPPAPAVQWEAIGRTVVAVLAALIVLPVRPIGTLHPPLLRRRLWLATSDEGRQPFDVFVIGRLEVLVPGLVVLLRLRLLLRLLMRLLVLWRLLVLLRLLIVRRLVLLRLLLALIVGLLLWRERLTANRRLVIVAVVKRV